MPAERKGNLGHGARSHERVKDGIAWARAGEDAAAHELAREGGEVGAREWRRRDLPHRARISRGTLPWHRASNGARALASGVDRYAARACGLALLVAAT